MQKMAVLLISSGPTSSNNNNNNNNNNNIMFLTDAFTELNAPYNKTKKKVKYQIDL